MKHTSGFTLIELLIAITIVALLTAVTVPAFLRFSVRQELSQGVAGVKTDLRTVQNRAISGIDREVGGVDYYWWGIEFAAESGDYDFVKSSNSDDPNDPGDGVIAVRTKSLPGSGLQIVGGGTVWFKMVTGEVFGTGAVVIRRVGCDCTERPDDCQDVTVSAGGRIE